MKLELVALCAVCALAPLASARLLRQDSTDVMSTFTIETATYKEANDIVSSALTAASLEDAVNQCDSNENCHVFSWCPPESTDGCSVSFQGTPRTLPAGGLLLSYDATDDNAGMLAVTGLEVPFISGVYRDGYFKGLVYAAQINGSVSFGPCPSSTDTTDSISPAPVSPGVTEISPPPISPAPTGDSLTTYLGPVANDCPSTCSAAGLKEVNGGQAGNALCMVTYNGLTFFGTKNGATPHCEFTDDAGEAYDWLRNSGASAYQCACVGQSEQLSWQADCASAGASSALGTPNACRVYNAHGNPDSYGNPPSNYTVGWIRSDTCYIPDRNWKLLGTSDLPINHVQGTTDDYKMQQLCRKSARAGGG
ncbi:hypothetical protein ABPG75_000225 [Micractinium tetrahymenae]